MANNDSQKRQLQAQINRIRDTIDGLEDTLKENPNDRWAREELRRKKQELQGLQDELNSRD
jgi:DNA-directed RNA polymerase specialized sigma subunit